MLLCASSPYARKGVLWQAYRDHYGRDDAPVLVWQSATRQMNPTISEEFIAGELERDPAGAAAEYLAQFRSDIEAFVSREVVDAAVIPGRHELGRVQGVRYAAFTDPSGGSRDAMTLAIAHVDDGVAVLDLVREVKPPFSPENVTRDFAATLKSYGISTVSGDRYSGEWPREQFRKCGVQYIVSDRPKSDLYRDLLPLLNSRKVELLDLPRLASQLSGLERRTARGGRDSIDHPPGALDDIANAVAGAVLLAARRTAHQTNPGVCPVVVAAPFFDSMGHPMPTLRDLNRRAW
jgi:hypothetical protein